MYLTQFVANTGTSGIAGLIVAALILLVVLVVIALLIRFLLVVTKYYKNRLSDSSERGDVTS
ncbi:hypothetical protein V3M78_08515 [Trueperella pyogenes]|uniref:hypothetical protein n=1 Tax=Trueperella pyogenes TaxID=1661 RepID=UPI000F8540F0|nr:hypothetical protein [Trueperella pyogenes]AZR03419.1 hypothetical protein EB775_08970 [Trueperella pyogenes]